MSMYIADGRKLFYQWDTDREMIVTDPDITELHFSNDGSENSLVCEVKDGKASVPNILLQTAGNLHVFGAAENHTENVRIFKVFPRPKPDDYVYTETEVLRWETLEHEVEDLKKAVEEAQDVFVIKCRPVPEKPPILPIIDVTKEDVRKAVKAGKTCILINSDGCVYTYFGETMYTSSQPHELCPTFIRPARYEYGEGLSYWQAQIRDSDLRVSFNGYNVAKTPNPNALTIKKGDEITVYDGSAAKSVELAEDNMFIVHAESAPPVLDKTYAQISEAVAAKKTILLTYNSVGEAGTTFYYAGFEDNKHVFAKIHKPTTPQPDGRIGIHELQIIVSPDNTAVSTIAMPATTPNPYKLIFNGAVNAEYDGSRDVKIEIPESGGSGLPTGGAPHQMLVTDAEGNAQWEDRLCYETFEDVTFLAEQAFAINEDGIGVIPAFLATPAAGDLCAVGWNGTEYTCTATALTVEGLDVVALGNASAFGGEISDEPFAIMILPENMAEVFGAAGQMFVLDDSQTVTLSISGKQSVVKKLDPRYVEIKGETVFLNISVSDDFTSVTMNYPYALYMAYVNAGKNIIVKIHAQSDPNVEYPIFLHLGAIDAAGIHFMGSSPANGDRIQLTVNSNDEESLSIGVDGVTLVSSNGTKWGVWVEDDGTLRTSMM